MSNDPYFMVPDELKNLLTQVTNEEVDDTIMDDQKCKETPPRSNRDEMPSYIAEIKSPHA